MLVIRGTTAKSLPTSVANPMRLSVTFRKMRQNAFVVFREAANHHEVIAMTQGSPWSVPLCVSATHGWEGLFVFHDFVLEFRCSRVASYTSRLRPVFRVPISQVCQAGRGLRATCCAHQRLLAFISKSPSKPQLSAIALLIGILRPSEGGIALNTSCCQLTSRITPLHLGVYGLPRCLVDTVLPHASLRGLIPALLD